MICFIRLQNFSLIYPKIQIYDIQYSLKKTSQLAILFFYNLLSDNFLITIYY